MNAEHDLSLGTDVDPMVAESPVEFTCRMLCRLALIAMIVIIDSELITRNIFGFSFNMSDEYGGYLLVALTFLSLPLCILHSSFHRVTFVLHQLPPRIRDVVLVAFNVVALVFALVILWQTTLLTINSRSLNATAPTLLMTPLWVPQLLMPIGMAASSVTLARLLFRRLARMQERA